MATKDNSGANETTGQYHSIKGNIVSTIGDVTGLESWQSSGKQEHREGEAEYNAATVQGAAEGISDRVGGYVSSVTGALAGDKSKQIDGNIQHDQGKAQQKINENA